MHVAASFARPVPAQQDAGWVGRAERRREDDALLRGAGLFVNDIRFPGCLHVAFVRGVRTGRIQGIDTAAAAAQPGVRGVFTADKLDLLGRASVNPLVAELEAAPPMVLAAGQVEAVGQPVAAVVASSAHAAAGAAELVLVEVGPGGDPPAGRYAQAWQGAWPGPAAPEGATVSVRIRHARVAPSPMEPRAALAAWDEEAGQLTAWLPTQTPHRARADLAAILGLPPGRVRVIAPDVGGAFGAKASIYPEDLFVAWAARQLRGAVRWAGSRGEDLLAGTHGRGLLCEGTLTVGADGRMLGLRARVQAPLGHWMPFSAVVPGRNAARILPGPYDLDAVDVAVEGRATPHAAMGIYRGAGRPEAAMLMERLADEAARRIGMDPFAFRRLNVLPPEGLPRRRPTGEVLDSGDLPGLLDHAEAESGYAARRREQEARRARGEVVGIGVALYVEPCGAGWEGASLLLRPDGGFDAATGSTAQGQGRETACAQILADLLRTEPGRIQVRHGDTGTTPEGIGALASRSTAIGGGALVKAASALVRLARPVAAGLLGANDPDGVALGPRGFTAGGRTVGWAEVAAAAEAPLQVSERFETPGEAWASGCCVAAVAIDPETMELRVEQVTLVDDAGTVVNPLLLEGQLMGGLAQGLGEAVLERVVYDADGQLLTGSLMDYALPRAADVPPVRLASRPVPTSLNPLGAKGVGEAGCIGLPAAVMNAALDALAPLGVRHLDLPLTSETIWRAVREAARNGAGQGSRK